MLKLIRLPNLLIVAITQYLLQYFVLIPALQQVGILPLLGHWPFFFLVLTTVLITAGGYVINDIIDFKADLINKPKQVIIENKISKRNALIIYWVIGITGATMALFLAIHVGQLNLFFIYPTAVILLYLYSKYFKNTPLIGNIVVSVFCAGVAGIVLFAERLAFTQLFETQPSLAFKITSIFCAYISYAFISTLLREVIKDLEDLRGDKKAGLKTMPIVYGVKNAKTIAIVIVTFLAFGIAYGSYWLYDQKEWVALFFILLGILCPLILVIYFLIKSSTKKHFSFLSKLTKFIMLAGLVLLILIWKF